TAQHRGRRPGPRPAGRELEPAPDPAGRPLRPGGRGGDGRPSGRPAAGAGARRGVRRRGPHPRYRRRRTDASCPDDAMARGRGGRLQPGQPRRN
ncbi:hypothetical protein FK507_28930, partial [Klebsiella pneumoniae]|nr:hypothetical protein [Klebsiella pneumoniae]